MNTDTGGFGNESVASKAWMGWLRQLVGLSKLFRCFFLMRGASYHGSP